MNKKEEIIYATLELAAEYGLKSLSMSQIAEKVGIKKPSLYNHFESKEILIKEMYQFIREKSKEGIPLDNIDYSAYLEKYNAKEILNQSVLSYKKMVTDEKMYNFYKVIYSERTINSDAAEILVEETKKMITATKNLFYVLQKNNKINIDNIDVAAMSFAMTIHSLIDYELDCKKTKEKFDEKMIQNYIEWFCSQYSEEE
ncbi:MAG: helix-turn-helix transcriptional regulator [Clostridia bacterium]|nr:helix-turn-helix transcriptional regulator [Clostridia bacterium]